MALLCLVLVLTACGGGEAPEDGGDSADEADAPMTEEEYQSRVEELSSDLGMAMASMSGLSATDEASFREGIENIRTMIGLFRDFAAITNPPEAWTEAHAKIAEGCNGFADALEGLCETRSACWTGRWTRRTTTAPPRNTPPISLRQPPCSPRVSG